MAVVYTAAVKNARLAAVVAQIGSTGVLEIGTPGMADIISTVLLNTTAGTVSNGVLTFSGFPKSDESITSSGVATEARIRTATDGDDVVTGLTVGTSGADVILNSTNIVAGQLLTITSMTITHA